MKNVIFNKERCKGCELCIITCPKKIIELSDTINSKGFKPAQKKADSECIGCAFCATICPEVAITVIEEDKKHE